MRVTGRANDDVSVFTCLIVVTVASADAMPNAAISAIRTKRGPMVASYSMIRKKPAPHLDGGGEYRFCLATNAENAFARRSRSIKNLERAGYSLPATPRSAPAGLR